MSATISISQTDIMTAVRSYLLGVLPAGVEVVKAEVNDLPMPKGEFVVMTPGAMRRLGTNIHEYTDPGTNPGTVAVTEPMEYTVQLDVYGASSQQNAAIISATFRDAYACDQFPATIAPCHADDATQMPMVTGEETYLQRWKLDLTFNINPAVTLPQDFAGKLEIGDAGNPIDANTSITTIPRAWNGLVAIDMRS